MTGKGEGRRLAGNAVPYIPRAITDRVDRGKSTLGVELEELKWVTLKEEEGKMVVENVSAVKNG
jgi:hypothetical protein